jgi:hypothetical protein
MILECTTSERSSLNVDGDASYRVIPKDVQVGNRRPSFRGVILGRGTETVLPGRLPIRKTLRRLGYESRARQLNFTPSIILATHSIVVLCSSSRMVAGEAVAEVAAELGFEQ